ncbi:MAG: SpoIIE family protein phosphatase [Spongiibacteraceae bacterium]
MAFADQCLLLIDDDESARLPIASYLRGVGFTVLEAVNGQQGLLMLRQHQPAVLFCDIDSSGINIPELLEVIKSLAIDIPMIVMSGIGVMNDVVEALRFGASDYLVKPIVDMEVLQHAVNRCLQQVQLHQENIAYQQQLEDMNRDLQQSLTVLKQDQLAGRQVQMKMLPARSLHIGEYYFNHKIVPSLLLSGDFVDYFTVGSHHAVFFLADVSGHGASSAFVTVLLKNMFARKRSDFTHRNDNSILSPIAMLDVANRNLLNTDIGKHATLCIGVIDLSNDELRYAVAGHLPLPLLATETGCRYLEGEGMPVGLFEDALYTEKRLQLPKNFVLTLFTDGILEVLPAEGLVEQEAFLRERLQLAPNSVEGIVAALELSHVVEVPDDIAVLVISKNTDGIAAKR